jgi:hypothetical protein
MHKPKASKNRNNAASRVLLGGAELSRKLRYITTTGTAAAAASAIVYGDGTTGTSAQPNLCSSWTGLAGAWQEYRVKAISVSVHSPVYNPVLAADATATALQVFTFHDRSGEISEANAAAASLAQLVDQEGSKFSVLSPYNPVGVHKNMIRAKDAEDFLWLPTQVASVDRYRLVLVFPQTVVAYNVNIVLEWHVEFKGRANSGLVELSLPKLVLPRQPWRRVAPHPAGCQCDACCPYAGVVTKP